MRYPRKYQTYFKYNRNGWGRAGKRVNRGTRWQHRPLQTQYYNKYYKYNNQERRMYQRGNYGVIPRKPKSLLERHGGYKQYFKTIKNLQRYEKDLYYAEDIAKLTRQRWPQDHY